MGRSGAQTKGVHGRPLTVASSGAAAQQGERAPAATHAVQAASTEAPAATHAATQAGRRVEPPARLTPPAPAAAVEVAELELDEAEFCSTFGFGASQFTDLACGADPARDDPWSAMLRID